MNARALSETRAVAVTRRPSAACALVAHVFHLDTLEDLSVACANFPAEADRFVTFDEAMSAEARRLIAAKLPGARLIPVRNVGQDVGALFALMDKVDLRRYDTVCKVHTKKGYKMPTAWRRTLLRGVLGSTEQVDRIIEAFATDSEVMLAGADQLFVHGPANLRANGADIEAVCGPLLGDFDPRARDWGFIAGTCFWIRTDILLRLKELEIRFEPGAYVDDGTSAHTVERMFGMMVAISGGKVLLFDQRTEASEPREVQGVPSDMARTPLSVVETLTGLENGRQLQGLPALSGRRRVAVFVTRSDDGLLPPQVRPYLTGLRSVAERIVVVWAGGLQRGEPERLGPLADRVVRGERGEDRFDLYRRGIATAWEAGWREQVDELIVCDDSCFGPINDFEPMFRGMEGRGLDFWGVTESLAPARHVDSSFMVFGWPVFWSAPFRQLVEDPTFFADPGTSIEKREIFLARTLGKAGFAFGGRITNAEVPHPPYDPTYRDLSQHPVRSILMGSPLVSAAALRSAGGNAEGPDRALDWLREHSPAIYEAASSDILMRRFEDAGRVGFSLIMPTHNRAWCIAAAIRSVMAQTHSGFELIVVDDGSTDGTSEVIQATFAPDLESGRIRYVRIEQNVGVCAARNVGLCHARHDWIGYADSDNEIRPEALAVVANAIIERPDADCFYGQLLNHRLRTVVGRPFVRADLLQGNYIDLGTFFHRKSLLHRFGGFDPDLRRLVDWDLIIRFTAHRDPVFIPRIFVDYTDEKEGQNAERISVRESFLKAKIAIHTKHHPRPTVSTVVISHNHNEYIVEAIESALEQRGDFTHEIVLSDDGSNDGTARIMARYAERYPSLVRNISRRENVGISENYKRCFREAEGTYLSILEGDDYWTDPDKNARQAAFLEEHSSAGAVFSRIRLLDMATGRGRLLQRQEGLPELLDGADFARNKHLNLIVNFSSMMLRRNVLLDLPSLMYEPRLSEITLAFYLDRLGKIGFLQDVMGVYRLNMTSVWTGASEIGKLEQAIATRRGALSVARPAFHATIRDRIDAVTRQLNSKRAEFGSDAVGRTAPRKESV